MPHDACISDSLVLMAVASSGHNVVSPSVAMMLFAIAVMLSYRISDNHSNMVGGARCASTAL